MEERYEIRGKIGQGGIGSVFRGFDLRMSREVAIKRILTSVGDPKLQEESTRQLMKEAGALASLQHPHIVTIYDVGTDEDGPYVVMELISGKTLDEWIENAPLTWPDFRELALQSQEALIAAHELDMIHSDLKPSNLMLTWLPSGKFQLKIVDFGLATLTQSQSKEEIESLDAVFGSIYFMAPEQFERVPLDARSDLYSMGCVYYQALTGIYPFNGETGNDVMGSHLHHTVTPVQDLRSDIPMWACNWIMWQINRLPQDRPESARDALSVFLENDKTPNPTMSLGIAQSDQPAPKRPRLIIPGSEPLSAVASVVVVEPIAQLVEEPVFVEETMSAPVPVVKPVLAAKPMLLVKRAPEPVAEPEPVAVVEPVAEPEPVAPLALVEEKDELEVELVTVANSDPDPESVAKPVLQVQPVVNELEKSAPPQSSSVVPVVLAASKPNPIAVLAPSKTKSAPQSLTPPVGSKPSVHTSPLIAAAPKSQSVFAATATSPIPNASMEAVAPIVADAVEVPKALKRKLSNAAKTMIAAVLGIIAVFLTWTLVDRSAKNRETASYNRIVTAAAVPGATEVPVNKIDLNILLEAAASFGIVENRTVIYQALVLAKATDGTDLDAAITEFATKRDMLPDVREILMRDVLRKRNNTSVVPPLMTFARATTDTRAAVAAIEAVRFMASDVHCDAFLEVIVGSVTPNLRKAAEDTLAQIIKKSETRNQLAGLFVTAYGNKLSPEARQAVLRLLGRCGGPKALELVKKALEGDDAAEKIAAITALSTWGDDSGYPLLIGFLANADEAKFRSKGFGAALSFAAETANAKDRGRAQKLWTELDGQAKTQEEKIGIINEMALLNDDWALKILEAYKGEDDARVSQRADKAIAHIGKQNPSKKDKDK